MAGDPPKQHVGEIGGQHGLIGERKTTMATRSARRGKISGLPPGPDRSFCFQTSMRFSISNHRSARSFPDNIVFDPPTEANFGRGVGDKVVANRNGI